MNRGGRIFPVVVLFLLTVAVFWKTLLTNQYRGFDSPDMTFQVAPWLQVQAAAWHRGHPLLWDPYQLSGQPLVGQGEPGAVYPFNWLLFLTPLKRGFIRDAAFEWYLALIRFMAALACYALCRDLGRSVAASILGACAFAFGGYIATTAWPYMLNGAVWSPVVFLFTLRALRGEKPMANAVLSGALLGVAWLSGHHQIPMFTALAVAGLWILHLARKDRVRRALQFGALVVTMILVSAAQTLPSLSYGREAVRWVNTSHPVAWNEPVPYSVHDEFSISPESTLGIFLNGLYTHSNPFVGIVVLALAILGVALAWREAPVRQLAAVALGALVFSFAGATILNGIIYALVPFAEKARNPAMAVVIFDLGASVLAAFGADFLLENAQSAWIRRVMLGCGAVAAAIWIFEAVVSAFHTTVSVAAGQIAMTGFAGLLLIVLLYALRTGAIEARGVRVMLVGLVMLEIGSLAESNLINRDLGLRFWNVLTRDADIAAFLKSRPGVYRTDFNRDDVPYNFGDWYGVEAFMGYVASGPRAFVGVQGYPRARDLFGVKYYVARQAPRPGLAEVFAGASGIKVFESATAMPRVWAVHETFPIGNLEELGPHLNHPSLDFGRMVLLMGAMPSLENCSGDQVRLARHEAQHVAIDAEMNCRGMLILADGYSKDWVATVDGKAARMYAAYGAARGVVVERGRHRIEMDYRPVSFYVGLGLTAATLLAVVLAWLFFWRGGRIETRP